MQEPTKRLFDKDLKEINSVTYKDYISMSDKDKTNYLYLELMQLNKKLDTLIYINSFLITGLVTFTVLVLTKFI